MIKLFMSEVLGTFFLVLTILLAGSYAGTLAPFAIAGALLFSIYAFGQVSGAHFNPAVSVAVYLRGKLKLNDLAYYIVAQLVGGIIAVMVGMYFAGFAKSGIAIDPILYKSPFDMYAGMIAELIFTFALCMTVLMVATSPKTDGNSFYGLAIGLVVLVGAFSVGKISGGAFNPAVAISTHLSNLDALGKNLPTLFVTYLIPELLAGALAGLGYKYLFNQDK